MTYFGRIQDLGHLVPDFAFSTTTGNLRLDCELSWG